MSKFKKVLLLLRKVIMAKHEHYKLKPDLTELADAIRKGDWSQVEKIFQTGVKLEKIEYYLFGRRLPFILGLILDILVMAPFSMIAEILGSVKIEVKAKKVKAVESN